VPKLLLADDSPTTQKVVQLTFADEGIDVVIADDGDSAIEMFDHHKPDIVLADINIPGLNGYEVCEAIRQREPESTTPVVLLAGSFEPFDVEAAHRVGANDYLTKPFSSIRRLVATVTALLDTVVRADETAHETVEPVDETPRSPAAESAAPMPAPGSKPVEQEEPDMFSTSDIDHLYTESIVEQPGTLENTDSAYKAPAEAGSVISEASDARLDESAFDDELIETTYVGSESGNGRSETLETPAEPVPLSTSVSLPHIPLPADDLPTNSASIPQSQIPTVSFEVQPAAEPYEKSIDTPSGVEPEPPVESSDVVDPESGQTDTSQLDQSGDETYFEPAIDQSNDALAQSVELSQTDTKDQISGSSPEANETPIAEHISEHAEAASSIDDPANIEAMPAAASTPWDSVAAEKPHRLPSDDANLLEVPYQISNNFEPADNDGIRANTTDQTREISPEIVERIAQLTAAQISEEMVREIAKRIVPQVIEEVLTTKNREE
jgi:CheY-like chemotaxis protein